MGALMLVRCLCVGLWVASAPVSAAEPEATAPKQDAERYNAMAAKHWENGDYRAALLDFQRAYALYPSPNLRFNIARVLGDLGRDSDALEAYEQFLAQGKSATDEARAVARTRIDELNRRLGRLLLKCPSPDADITIDGKSMGH